MLIISLHYRERNQGIERLCPFPRLNPGLLMLELVFLTTLWHCLTKNISQDTAFPSGFTILSSLILTIGRKWICCEILKEFNVFILRKSDCGTTEASGETSYFSSYQSLHSLCQALSWALQT